MLPSYPGRCQFKSDRFTQRPFIWGFLPSGEALCDGSLTRMSADAAYRARVLWQEDEPTIRAIQTMDLIAAGFEVVPASDNAEARSSILGGRPFNAIVLNGRLPDGSGVDLCAELRRAGVKAPILIQSGDGMQSDIVRAMRAGASDYLSKPWLSGELVSRIEDLIQMPPLVVARGHRGTLSSRESNLQSANDFCLERVASALRHLSEVRPAEETAPEPEVVKDENGRHLDTRIVALSESGSDELLKTLTAIEHHLASGSDDADERSKLRAQLAISALGYQQLACRQVNCGHRRVAETVCPAWSGRLRSALVRTAD